MKRLLSGLLTAVMSVSLLAGSCFTAAAEEDVYDMNMEIITYGFDDVDLQEVEDAVNEISVPEVGVRVHFVTVAISEMMQKLPLMAASNEKIDLVQSGLLTTPSILASQGLIQPMTDYLSEDMIAKAGKMIHAGEIGGAAIDVMCEEPPDVDSRLLQHPKCIVTPHIAAFSCDFEKNFFEASVAKLRSICNALNR